jgi:hypothetical protein
MTNAGVGRFGIRRSSFGIGLDGSGFDAVESIPGQGGHRVFPAFRSNQAIDRTAGTRQRSCERALPEQKLFGKAERRMSPENRRLEAVAELCGDCVRFVAPQTGAEYLRRNGRPCQTPPGSAQAVKLGIGPGRGDRVPRETEQQVKAWQLDMTELLSATAGDTRTVHQESRDVAAQRGGYWAQSARAQSCCEIVRRPCPVRCALNRRAVS